jgi:hypothetical protein
MKDQNSLCGSQDGPRKPAIRFSEWLRLEYHAGFRFFLPGVVPRTGSLKGTLTQPQIPTVG